MRRRADEQSPKAAVTRRCWPGCLSVGGGMLAGEMSRQPRFVSALTPPSGSVMCWPTCAGETSADDAGTYVHNHTSGLNRRRPRRAVPTHNRAVRHALDWTRLISRGGAAMPITTLSFNSDLETVQKL